MNPRTIVLAATATVAAIIVLVYLLLPEAERPSVPTAEGGSGISLGQPSHTQRVRPANERNGMDLQADQRIRELEARLTDAESKGAEQKRSNAPLADPEMRKVMQAEAAAGVKKGVAALFEAGLADELQLTEEQRMALERLLSERGLAVWDQILIPMAAGELDPTRMAVAGRSVRQSMELNLAEIRSLLGNDRFATYERYERTQPDRDSLKQMSPKFVEAGLELGEEQRNELLNVMAVQRAQFPLGDFGDPMKIDYGRFNETFSEENTNKYFEEKQRFNERLVQEAQRTLTAEQAVLFRNLLATQLQRAKFTIRTTRAMMGQTR